MKIYCFSGLGADERAFQYMNFSPYEIVHMQWIEPQQNESLQSYALRMGSVIDQSEPFTLMGLSFGGMLVQELAKTMQPHQTILISTISGKHERPILKRLSNSFNLFRFVPDKYFTKPSKIAFRMFGATTEKEKQLLTDFLIESDPNYIRWALKSIVQWNNKIIVPAFRIHGSNDTLFPLKYVKNDYTVVGGGHFMVVTHPNEIQQKIIEAIDKTLKIKMAQ